MTQENANQPFPTPRQTNEIYWVIKSNGSGFNQDSRIAKTIFFIVKKKGGEKRKDRGKEKRKKKYCGWDY